MDNIKKTALVIAVLVAVLCFDVWTVIGAGFLAMLLHDLIIE